MTEKSILETLKGEPRTKEKLRTLRRLFQKDKNALSAEYTAEELAVIEEAERTLNALIDAVDEVEAGASWIGIGMGYAAHEEIYYPYVEPEPGQADNSHYTVQAARFPTPQACLKAMGVEPTDRHATEELPTGRIEEEKADTNEEEWWNDRMQMLRRSRGEPEVKQARTRQDPERKGKFFGRS